MLRLLRLLFTLCLLLILVLTLVWYQLPEQERPLFIAWLRGQLPDAVDARVAELQPPITRLLSAAKTASVHTEEGFQPVGACGKTRTAPLEKKPSASIYRWTDENGQVHFSDAKPGATRHSDLMAVTYPERLDYFKLRLIEDTDNLPAFTRDRISADVQQIYSILSRDLALAHLRQVFLNVRVIAGQTQFQQYRAQVAPRIRTNSGFYTSVDNEAVVFQGQDAEAMRAVIRHESTHVIMAGLYGITPSWFNEGLAEYFEQLILSGQSRQVRPVAYHWSHLQQRHNSGALPALRDYLDLPAQRRYAGNLQDHYALAWSLVYFLMSEPAGQMFLKGMMNQMAQDYCSPLQGSAYLDAHYPGGLAAFKRRWHTWLQQSLPAPHRY